MNIDKNITLLLQANYQRMMTFEQAANLTEEASFREFYSARAEESEENIRQICQYYQLDLSSIETFGGLAGRNFTLIPNQPITSRKPSKILASLKTFEKSVAHWYKTIMGEIKDLPGEIALLVDGQYRMLNNAQVQLEHL